MPARHTAAALMFISWAWTCQAQTPYFPPTAPNANWETLDPASLGWCQDRIDSLYNYLDAHHTKGFIMLKDGRIVLEHYFGTFTQDSLWYWASAGKTLTSTVVGIAQAEGFLGIQSPTSTYLGAGWTSETPAQEAAITVRNQLTMTTGLDDGVTNPDCTTPACLSFLAPAGDRWAYHNAPYTLLHQVVANATGQAFAAYFNAKLRNPIGMDGIWAQMSGNTVYVSRLRSMARFGLLASHGMVWGTDTLLRDTAYVHAAITPSQQLNRSYGYLWWLNGQTSFMLPQTQFVFPGPLMPHAPADMYSALGKNDQLINVAPSRGIVMARMGNAAQESVQVSAYFDDIIWQYINALECSTGVVAPQADDAVALMPNPATGHVHVAVPTGAVVRELAVLDGQGRVVLLAKGKNGFDADALAPGAYLVRITTDRGTATARMMKE